MNIHHIGYLVSDIQLAIDQFECIGAILKDAVIYDSDRQVDIAFMQMGTYSLELVSPREGSEAIGKALRKIKNTPYHICYECEDLDKEITKFVEGGCLIIEEPSNAVAIQNRKVSFLYSKEMGLFELVETKSDIE